MTIQNLKAVLGGCPGSDGLPYIAKANGHLVATMCDRNESNARLLAAAPDMLAALKEICRNAAISDEWLSSIHAVIAKAEGRAP